LEIETMRNLLLGTIAGATAAYFYLGDPRDGARRRAAFRERLARLPGFAAVAGAVGGPTGGPSAGATRSEFAQDTDSLARSAAAYADAGAQPTDDADLAQKVRSEVFEAVDVPRSGINVNAERGVVVLRGQVETEQEIDALEEAVRRVSGVRDVDNRLHLPGVPGASVASGAH
jgi:hypothetical protein